jgi:hypothetical protein
MIGTATAAKALPDGCTMVIVNQNFVVQPAIGEKLAYEVPDSFTPVTLLIVAPEVRPTRRAAVFHRPSDGQTKLRLGLEFAVQRG